MLQQQIMALLLEAVPAECASVIQADASGGIGSVASCVRDGAAPSRVSRTVVSGVLQRGLAMLSNDLPAQQELAGAASLVTSRVTSVLCVPLIRGEKAIGALYLDSRDASNPFDVGHLELATGVAGLASVALEAALHVERLEGDNRRLEERLGLTHDLVGDSAPMQQALRAIGKVARTDATVLLRGESGTGKELAARAIHDSSARASGPFVAINCASLSETLLESELFGHERGAFTGAVSQERGKLETADGGTFFLDEVGELALSLQARLLRVLQEREFERVGGRRTIRVDVRVVAATNRDLEAAIRAGAFRQDLYYRLDVVTIKLPPLRDRPEDIEPLAQHFASRLGPRLVGRKVGVSSEAVACLRAYSWPGNVRELENAIERAIVLGSSPEIQPEDLPECVLESESADHASPIAQYHEALKQAKKDLILGALGRSSGNVTEAARELGVHPNYLHRLLTNLGLRDGGA